MFPVLRIKRNWVKYSRSLGVGKVISDLHAIIRCNGWDIYRIEDDRGLNIELYIANE